MSVLERLSELLPALPPGLIEAWGQLVLFAVPVCLYLAAVVLPFVVLYGLIRAHFGRRSLLERCSRQQARFANFLNWLFLVCFVGLGLSKVVPYETFPPLYQAGLYLSAGLLLGGTIIWTVVVAAWKPLRGWPVLHGFLAFLTGSSLACLPIIGLILGRVALQGTELPQENDLQTLIGLLLPSASDPFWLYFGLIHFLEVASAGALGLFWLLVRRKIDDFGRDYYVFAANWCGEWAAWGGWFSLIMAGVLCFMLQTQDLLTLENQGALLFVAALFAALLIPGKPAVPVRLTKTSPHSPASALNTAITVMATVCGWVVLFRVLLAFLKRWIFWILPAAVQVAVTGILELSNGCCELLAVTDVSARFCICSGMLAFGGLCVTMQTVSVTAGLSLKPYFLGKLLQTLFSLALAALIAYGIWLPFGVLSVGALVIKLQKRGSFSRVFGV